MEIPDAHEPLQVVRNSAAHLHNVGIRRQGKRVAAQVELQVWEVSQVAAICMHLLDSQHQLVNDGGGHGEERGPAVHEGTAAVLAAKEDLVLGCVELAPSVRDRDAPQRLVPHLPRRVLRRLGEPGPQHARARERQPCIAHLHGPGVLADDRHTDKALGLHNVDCVVPDKKPLRPRMLAKAHRERLRIEGVQHGAPAKHLQCNGRLRGCPRRECVRRDVSFVQKVGHVVDSCAGTLPGVGGRRLWWAEANDALEGRVEENGHLGF
mmetsp:Transcript_30998/g.88872  ORF Transcript_30998/g.88872 Transcript_30998/m.88872 type:complete len:265 (+) Transcript_30998:356-1150(+)